MAYPNSLFDEAFCIFYFKGHLEGVRRWHVEKKGGSPQEKTKKLTKRGMASRKEKTTISPSGIRCNKKFYI